MNEGGGGGPQANRILTGYVVMAMIGGLLLVTTGRACVQVVRVRIRGLARGKAGPDPSE